MNCAACRSCESHSTGASMRSGSRSAAGSGATTSGCARNFSSAPATCASGGDSPARPPPAPWAPLPWAPAPWAIDSTGTLTNTAASDSLVRVCRMQSVAAPRSTGTSPAETGARSSDAADLLATCPMRSRISAIGAALAPLASQLYSGSGAWARTVRSAASSRCSRSIPDRLPGWPSAGTALACTWSTARASRLPGYMPAMARANCARSAPSTVVRMSPITSGRATAPRSAL